MLPLDIKELNNTNLNRHTITFFTSTYEEQRFMYKRRYSKYGRQNFSEDWNKIKVVLHAKTKTKGLLFSRNLCHCNLTIGSWSMFVDRIKAASEKSREHDRTVQVSNVPGAERSTHKLNSHTLENMTKTALTFQV